MDRRKFLDTTIAGFIIAGYAGSAMAAERYFPTKVNQSLFEGINRVKDKAAKTPLEKGHAPVINTALSVTAGQPFIVEVAIGESLHPMGLSHWIEYIEINIGNEPAGRVDLQSKGYLQPKVAFTLKLPKEVAPEGKVSLVARQFCNLHGLWEESLDVTVT